MLNIAFYLDAAARRDPDAVAAIHNGRRYSYGELHRLANQVANGLVGLGFGPGDRVAIACSNRPGFIAVCYGVHKVGATAVLLTTGLRRHDIAFQLADSEARALFTFDGRGDPAFADQAIEAAEDADACEKIWLVPSHPLAESKVSDCPPIKHLMAGQPTTFETLGRDRDETALILYTSGSTGRPKGVEITHANITAMVMINLPLTEPGATRMRLVVTPLYHIIGQVFCMNLSVLCGETMVLAEEYDPALLWRLIVDEGVSHVVLMPMYYKWLLDRADGVDAGRVRETLRLCATGGAPLPAAWSDEFESRFGQPIVPGYGMTEATSIVTWHSPHDRLKVDSVGPPVPGVDVRLIDAKWNPLPPTGQGEIAVRSPGVMKGYLNMPETTAAVLHDGWYRTGDIGTFDDDGYLYLLGGVDDMIKRGGELIYPAEIENRLHEHPLVARAAAVPVPHPVLGQEAKTFVQLKTGKNVTEAELLRWLECELPQNRCPGVIEFRTSLPLTDTGKVARHLLS